MSTFKKRLILTMLGVIGGLTAWPVVELVIANQSVFPSYLLFSVVFGMIFGVILGAFFGTYEGIITSDTGRILAGAFTGSLVGAAGGAIGFLTGQAALFLAGTILFRSRHSFALVGLPVSRAIGWAVMGICIGMTEGIRARSLKKIGMGILGGVLGGLLGGFALEYLKVLFPQLVLARLAGLVLFGALIGLCYSIIEKQLSFGILKVLNGAAKGKEFLINQDRLRIGSHKRNDICLPGYNLKETHAQLEAKRGDVRLKKSAPDAPVLVNDQPAGDQILKYEDVLKIGTLKLFYKHE